MKQTDPQMKIRLPPGLKDKVAESAVVNNRSMTAEIISRLEATFSEGGDGEPEKIPPVRIVLDANSLPICWHEIDEHLRQINKSFGYRAVSLSVSVVTSELVSSEEREDRAAAVRRAYRTKMAAPDAAQSAPDDTEP